MNNNNKEIGNVGAEKGVLQGLLDNRHRKSDYDIREEDFTDDLYKTIFKLLVKYNGNEDLVDGEMKKAGGIIENEWNTLQAYHTQYITDRIEEDVYVLKNLTKKRQQIQIAENIQQAIAMGKSEDEVLQIANKLYETETIKEQSREEVKAEIINDIFGTKEVRRYLVNYRDIDLMTGGFYPNQLITIAARPGIGKTLIALNFVANQLQAGHKVALFSLEMGAKELYQRLYARFGMIEVNKLKGSKELIVGDQEKIEKAVEKVNEFENNLYLYDTKNGLGEIVNQIRSLHAKGLVDIVYIDYVQLIEVKAENRNLEISRITRTLKLLAMQLKIPIVILAQLSRAVEKRAGGDEPILSDLRDSGSIEQDSDVVLMLHRMEDGNLKVLIRKNRNGPLGPCYQKINPRYMQIGDMTEKEKSIYSEY